MFPRLAHCAFSGGRIVRPKRSKNKETSRARQSGMKDPRPAGPFEPALAHFFARLKKLERKNTGRMAEEEKEQRTAQALGDVTAGPSSPRDCSARAR